MVKKLVANIMKKGEKKDVPNELPPLNADAPAVPSPAVPSPAAPSPAAPSPAAPSPAAPSPAVPDELPSIEAPEPQPAPTQPPTPVHPPEPQPHPAAATEELVPPPAAPAPLTDMSTPPADLEPIPLPTGEAHEGFFNKLGGIIQTQRGNQVTNTSLLGTMKENYNIRKESVKTGLSSTEERRLKHTIDEVLSALKLLEGKWRAQRLVLDEDERQLKEYEEQISGKEHSLKGLLKHYTIYETQPNVSLILKNYIEVRNLSELYNTLRLLDQPTYLKHISKSKNDFADFVHHFDARLAGKIKRAKTKKNTLSVLHEFIEKYKAAEE